MSKQSKINRRQFLIWTGATAGAGMVICGGLGMLATAQPAVDFKELTLLKKGRE